MSLSGNIFYFHFYLLSHLRAQKTQKQLPQVLLKRDSNTGFFLWNFRNFSEHAFWRISVDNWKHCMRHLPITTFKMSISDTQCKNSLPKLLSISEFINIFRDCNAPYLWKLSKKPYSVGGSQVNSPLIGNFAPSLLLNRKVTSYKIKDLKYGV